MSLKVSVHKTDEPPQRADSFVFHQERITIGRDSANDLPLNDFKRVVSKQHAEISTKGDAIQLTDLGSKNFTYLNGERLQSGRSYPVLSGDTVQIGDFEIKVERYEEAPEPEPEPVMPSYDDRTVFDVSFVNPFTDSAKLMAVALRSLSKQYDEEAPSRRDDAFEEALRMALDGDQEHSTHRLLARLLAPSLGTAPSASTLTPSPGPPTASLTRDAVRPGASVPASRLEQLIGALIESIARLIGVPWQFRHEFIGQTIVQSEETAFLYDNDAASLKAHLLDEELADDEVAHRFRLLEEALADVERHQVAILDGYRAGVREGATHLIDQLNPDALEEEARGASVLYRLFPPLAKSEVLRRLRDQLRELRGEDWSSAERRTYRPAFIKAYLARMTAARRPDNL